MLLILKFKFIFLLFLAITEAEFSSLKKIQLQI